MDFNATMQKVVGNHAFELYLMGNTLDPDPDPTPYWYSTQATDEKGNFGWNIAAFRSKKADKLLDMNRKQLNTADRKATLQEFGVLLNKELPWVPLYAADIAKAYRFHGCGTGLPENIRCDGSKAVKSRAVQSVFYR